MKPIKRISLIALSLIIASCANDPATNSTFETITEKEGDFDLEKVKEQLVGTWAIQGMQPFSEKRYYNQFFIFKPETVMKMHIVSDDGVTFTQAVAVSGTYTLTPEPSRPGVYSLQITPEPNKVWRGDGPDNLTVSSPEKGTPGWINMTSLQNYLKQDHKIRLLGGRLFLDGDIDFFAYGYVKTGAKQEPVESN